MFIFPTSFDLGVAQRAVDVEPCHQGERHAIRRYPRAVLCKDRMRSGGPRFVDWSNLGFKPRQRLPKYVRQAFLVLIPGPTNIPTMCTIHRGPLICPFLRGLNSSIGAN